MLYSVFRERKDYDLATIVGIARAVNWQKPIQDYTVAVYVDGLTKVKRLNIVRNYVYWELLLIKYRV